MPVDHPKQEEVITKQFLKVLLYTTYWSLAYYYVWRLGATQATYEIGLIIKPDIALKAGRIIRVVEFLSYDGNLFEW